MAKDIIHLQIKTIITWISISAYNTDLIKHWISIDADNCATLPFWARSPLALGTS